jgi:hypothetical protein
MSGLISFSSTGTDAGYSKAKKWLGCKARAAADERAEQERNGAPWPLFPEEGKPIANTCGSLLGELQQRFYRGEPVRDSVQFAWDGVSMEQSHPLTCAEVRRLYKAYTQKHDPDGFGEVLGCEVAVEIPESLFGMRMTGAIDMVAKRGDDVYLIDFKTEGRNDSLMKERYGLLPQLHIYALGYELKTGVKPAGVIYEVTVKTKTPDFHRLPFEGLTEQRFRWIKGVFHSIIAAKQGAHEPSPSENNCLSYYRACPFLGSTGCCSFL